MSETKVIPIEDLIGRPDDPVEQGHDAWFRTQVEEALAKVKRGEAKFTPWEVVRKKFDI